MSSMYELEGKLWLVWIHMKERCKNPNNPAYKHYGGRGIRVEKPWDTDRKSFYQWAHENGYKEGLQLDRTNNNGNYSPSNCRWATRSENMKNTRRAVMITIGDETKNKSDWMKDPRVPIGYGTYYKRKKKGWTDEECLFTPPDERYQR